MCGCHTTITKRLSLLPVSKTHVYKVEIGSGLPRGHSKDPGLRHYDCCSYYWESLWLGAKKQARQHVKHFKYYSLPRHNLCCPCTPCPEDVCFLYKTKPATGEPGCWRSSQIPRNAAVSYSGSLPFFNSSKGLLELLLSHPHPYQ